MHWLVRQSYLDSQSSWNCVSASSWSGLVGLVLATTQLDGP